MNNIIHYIKEKKVYFISFGLILFGFHICYGLGVILPGNINWLMSAYHDWGQHYLGWAYFKEEPWHFPLGHIENFNYPAGTNIGYTDSIPLLAIFFKLFSFLLPDTFQYLGFWLFACHILAGYFTVKILEEFKVKNIYIILAAVVLVAFNPVLIYRGLHPALCGHWLILASIYLYFKKSTNENAHQINRNQVFILILSALINPYLFLMVLGFNVILPFRNYFYDKTISIWRMLSYIVVSLISVLLSWFVLGMISVGNDVNMEVANSYGLYSFNLNSFYNSSGFSTFLPQLKQVTEHQYEGYAYMGLGMIVILAISVFYSLVMLLFKKQNILKNKALLPLVIISLLITFFAITNKVTLDDKIILEFALPELILKLGGVFRACGRFIWVLYYILFLFGIIVFAKMRISNKIKLPVLMVLVALQIYDTKLFFTFRDLPDGDFVSEKINSKKLLDLSSNFKRIITYPPFENNMNYHLDYQDLCFVALKNNLPITTGYVARETGELNRKFRDSLKINLDEAVINKNDLFITTAKYLDAFYPLIYKNKVTINYSDGFYYLYSKETPAKFTFKQSGFEMMKIDSVYKEIKKANKIEKINKPVFQKQKIKYSLESNSFANDILQLRGWAYSTNSGNNLQDSIYVLLTNDKSTYLIKTKSFERPDVADVFKNQNLKNAGFSASIFTSGLGNNQYKLGLGIKDKNGNWTYELVEQAPVIDLKKPSLPRVISEKIITKGKVIGNVEKAEEQVGNIYVRGWAAVENKPATNSVITLVFIGKDATYEMDTDKIFREDVTAYYGSKYNYNESGYNLKVKKTNFKSGVYTIAIRITDKSNVVSTYISDKNIVIK